MEDSIDVLPKQFETETFGYQNMVCLFPVVWTTVATGAKEVCALHLNQMQSLYSSTSTTLFPPCQVSQYKADEKLLWKTLDHIPYKSLL